MFHRFLTMLLIIQLLLSFNLCSKKEKTFTLKKDLEIGVLEGDENYIFGAINDIELDEEENIYVLDPKNTRVQKFNKDGEFLFSLKLSKGEGPGEVFGLLGLALTDEGNICLLDTNRKVVIFDKNGNFLNSFKIDFGASYIMSIGKNIILLGLRKEHILHIFDQKGKLIQSFGKPFEVPPKYSQYKDVPFLKSPLRANISTHGKIFVLNPHKYEIRIYEGNNIKRWIRHKSEFFTPLMITKSNVGIGIFFPYVSVLEYKNRLYVTIRGLGQNATNQMDIFENYKYIASLKAEGFAYAIDKKGYLYFAEEEEFPKVVRYALEEYFK